MSGTRDWSIRTPRGLGGNEPIPLYRLTRLRPPTPPEHAEGNGDSKDASEKGFFDEYSHIILALVILIPYVIFFGYLVFEAPPAPTLETLAASYGSLAAAVVGYYFGLKPAKDAQKNAQDAAAQQQKLRGNVVDIVSQLAGIQQQLTAHKTNIQELHRGSTRLHEEARKLPKREDTVRLMELATPEVLESQKSKVDADVQQVDLAIGKIDEIRKNSMRLLE